MGAPRPGNGHRILSRDEYRALVEERVQKYLGMSLDEFLAALDRGDLPDSAAVSHLEVLVGAASDESASDDESLAIQERANLSSS
jgi:hypothetical protein